MTGVTAKRVRRGGVFGLWGLWRGLGDRPRLIYIRPSRPIRLELTEAPVYPPITAMLQAPRKLKDFGPTPWGVGSAAEPAEGAPEQLLEFRLAPHQR